MGVSECEFLSIFFSPFPISTFIHVDNTRVESTTFTQHSGCNVHWWEAQPLLNPSGLGSQVCTDTGLDCVSLVPNPHSLWPMCLWVCERVCVWRRCVSAARCASWKGSYPSESMLFSWIMAFKASVFAGKEREGKIGMMSELGQKLV